MEINNVKFYSLEDFINYSALKKTTRNVINHVIELCVVVRVSKLPNRKYKWKRIRKFILLPNIVRGVMIGI